jgi:hypothetical protein
MMTVRERPARVQTGNLSPCSDVCGEKKRFNAFFSVMFLKHKSAPDAAVCAPPRGLLSRTAIGRPAVKAPNGLILCPFIQQVYPAVCNEFLRPEWGRQAPHDRDLPTESGF